MKLSTDHIERLEAFLNAHSDPETYPEPPSGGHTSMKQQVIDRLIPEFAVPVRRDHEFSTSAAARASRWRCSPHGLSADRHYGERDRSPRRVAQGIDVRKMDQ